MAIPAPNQNTILMREHEFRSTKRKDLVLDTGSSSFVPIQKKGLGFFNYQLIDLKDVSVNNNIDHTSHANINSNLVIITFVSTALIVIYLILTLRAWSKVRKHQKEKVEDYDTSYNSRYNENYDSMEGVPHLSATDSPMIVDSSPNTPQGSLISLMTLSSLSDERKSSYSYV